VDPAELAERRQQLQAHVRRLRAGES
jgi:hypothetical protein